MIRDLLGTALRGDVLGTHQGHASTVLGDIQQILGHEWHGSTSAFLPGGIGRRVDNDLPYHPPSRVVRVAAGDQKPREGLSDAGGSVLRAMLIKVTQCLADAATVVHRSGDLGRGSPRLAFNLDTSTVLAGSLA